MGGQIGFADYSTTTPLNSRDQYKALIEQNFKPDEVSLSKLNHYKCQEVQIVDSSMSTIFVCQNIFKMQLLKNSCMLVNVD